LISEGVPTVLFALVVFLFLPDSPGSAKFLDETEQTEAVERLQTIDRTAKNKLQWKQVTSGLKDYKNYVHMTIHFCCNFSFSALSNFLPTIIQTMGYTSVNAQGLSAPPYFASFLCCIVAAVVSDRWGNRGYVVTFFAVLGTIGYLILTCVTVGSKTGARYTGIWLATCGIFPALSINIVWLLNNQGGESKKGAGMAMLAIFGQCSSLISSSVFPNKDAPFYTTGCALGCVFTGLIAILAMGLHISLTLENRKRDRLYGQVSEHHRVDVTEGGDQNPAFRYLT
jgi:dipeptide/tripeptide permease